MSNIGSSKCLRIYITIQGKYIGSFKIYLKKTKFQYIREIPCIKIMWCAMGYFLRLMLKYRDERITNAIRLI